MKTTEPIVIGTGKLELRHRGKHLILVHGKRSRRIRFAAAKLIGAKVEVQVRVLAKPKKRKTRFTGKVYGWP